MYGVIFFWKVRPDRRAEHAEIVTGCDADGWRTMRFEHMEFLGESFVRAAAGVGHAGT